MAIKFYYQFRDISEEQARVAQYALKRLFRRGTLSEGVLSNSCALKAADERWQSTLAKLVTYQLVSVAQLGDTRKIALTSAGSEYASELLGKEQTDAGPVKLAPSEYWRPDPNPELATMGCKIPTNIDQLTPEQFKEAKNRGII